MTQSIDDPTTWAWTQNLALIVLDYFWHQDGMRLPRSLIENALDDWSDQADICDEDVALKSGGTEKRYRLSGMYSFDEAPKAILRRMLDPGDARLKMRADGQAVIRVGRPVEPTVWLDDSKGHILSYQSLRRGAPRGQLKNEIRAQFLDVENGYQEGEAEPWRNEASINTDGLQSAGLDLTWAPSHRQSRVRQKVEAFRRNPEWSGELLCNAYGLNCIGEEVIGLRLSDFGIEIVVEASLEIDPITWTVKVTFASAPDRTWDPTADEGTAPAVPPQGSADDVESPEGLSVNVQGAAPAYAMNASWDEPVAINLTAQAAWRVHDDGVEDEDATWTDMTVSDDTAQSGQVEAGEYDVRVRFKNPQSKFGDYAYVRAIFAPSLTGDIFATESGELLVTETGEFIESE